MDIHDLPYRLKSARRKKRLVKEALDKKLISLYKQQLNLRSQIRSLPPVPLEKPYQKGWVRHFILRADIARSERGEFYQTLLDKINTYCRHHDKSFKRRKIRKGTYHYFDAKYQKLQELDPDDFHGSKLNLSDAEKHCFYLKEVWDNRYRHWKMKYVFIEQWRFVLVIRPNIIYTAKQIDEELERQLNEISKFIDWNGHWPRISKLKGETSSRWDFFENPLYINELKNKPKYLSKEACSDY